MKSEERHQLLTNDLGVVTERTVGFFERHLGTVIGVVCGALLLAAIGFWWTRSSGADNAAGWTMLDSAQNLEEFGTVLDKFKGKPPGQWAQLQIAETTMRTGLPQMFTNRESAVADLKRAREGFESLLQDKTAQPVIRERSMWGLALCLEATCDGNTAKAIEAFERLLSEFPDTIFKTVAKDRITALNRPGAKEFYAWFSKETPKPPEIRPRDFKTDGTDKDDPDNDPDDFEPKLPAKVEPETKSDAPPVTDEKPDTPAKPADAENPAEPAKPVEPPKSGEAEKPTETESVKNQDKPPEKN
jgi:hypothetical protein